MTRPAALIPITVVIPTLNEASRIADAIGSVSWAAETIVADGGSSDDTVARARARGAIVLEGTGPTIGAQRNAAIERASNEWILALDADERATTALASQLARVVTDGRSAQHTFDSYRVRRSNSYLGRVMRHGRFARDWHLCVFRRACRFDTKRVHESLIDAGNTGRLAGPIDHTPYRDLAHHAGKVVQYATWAAADRDGRPRGPSIASLVVKPPVRFVRDYVVYGGWLDGWRGAVAAAMSAYSVFLRAALIRERRTGA